MCKHNENFSIYEHQHNNISIFFIYINVHDRHETYNIYECLHVCLLVLILTCIQFTNVLITTVLSKNFELDVTPISFRVYRSNFNNSYFFII